MLNHPSQACCIPRYEHRVDRTTVGLGNVTPALTGRFNINVSGPGPGPGPNPGPQLAGGAPMAQTPACNPCQYDPLYNPPCPAPCPAPLVPADPFTTRRAVATWKVNYLISNRSNQAAHLDQELVNPWGIAVYNNQLWVVNNYTDRITNYDLFGNRLLGSISVRDAVQDSTFPTGLAINCGSGFNVTNGNFTKAGLFVISTEAGTVTVYNPNVDQLNSFLILNNQLTGDIAKYKGLAIAHGILYLADFFQSHIDVFDSAYNRLLGYHFIDGDTSDPIPLDYGPVNIVHIGCHMYVLWAKKDPNVTIHSIEGPGLGYISVFNPDGSFVRRFTSRGVLNNPWAMIPAPCECGFPPGSFIVSNHGDGRCNVFDCNGRYVGPLLNQDGLPLTITGIRGLAPYYTDFNEIFFTAAYEEDIEGLVGSFVRDQIIYF